MKPDTSRTVRGTEAPTGRTNCDTCRPIPPHLALGWAACHAHGGLAPPGGALPTRLPVAPSEALVTVARGWQHRAHGNAPGPGARAGRRGRRGPRPGRL